MRLLRINENVGQFLAASGDYVLIDRINKDDLLRLVDRVLDQDEIELDPYDDQLLKNQAHQVIYRSVYQKLTELRGRRQEFIDESARLFLGDYEKYRQGDRQGG